MESYNKTLDMIFFFFPPLMESGFNRNFSILFCKAATSLMASQLDKPLTSGPLPCLRKTQLLN